MSPNLSRERPAHITTPPLPIIRPADLADLKFITHLQIRERESLGWITTHATASRLETGDVSATVENDEICGFLLSAPRLAAAPHIHPIFQAAICYDLQRRRHGFALVAAEEARARAARCSILSLWCAADLEANDFWRAAGFTAINVRQGGAARKRTHILWRKPLTPDALPLMFVRTRPTTNGPGGAYRPGNAARRSIIDRWQNLYSDPDLQIPANLKAF